MEEVARFQARTRGLPSFGEADVAVQGLVRALRHYMGGHLDLGWGYSARRYRPLEVPPPLRAVASGAEPVCEGPGSPWGPAGPSPGHVRNSRCCAPDPKVRFRRA